MAGPASAPPLRAAQGPPPLAAARRSRASGRRPLLLLLPLLIPLLLPLLLPPLFRPNWIRESTFNYVFQHCSSLCWQCWHWMCNAAPPPLAGSVSIRLCWANSEPLLLLILGPSCTQNLASLGIATLSQTCTTGSAEWNKQTGTLKAKHTGSTQHGWRGEHSKQTATTCQRGTAGAPAGLLNGQTAQTKTRAGQKMCPRCKAVRDVSVESWRGASARWQSSG